MCTESGTFMGLRSTVVTRRSASSSTEVLGVEVSGALGLFVGASCFSTVAVSLLSDEETSAAAA